MVAAAPEPSRSNWRRARRSAALRNLLPALPITIFLIVLFFGPVLNVLSLSLFDTKGAVTLIHYQRLFASSVYLSVLGTTFWFSVVTTLLVLGIGYPLAYFLATANTSTRNLLLLGVLIPFWTSFLVRTFAWVVLLGRNGGINRWLQATGITDAPLALIYNATGVLVGLVHAMLPLAVLTMVSAMQAIDTRLTNAARTLGARGSQSFWNVYFPLSLPGVAAAGILVFVSTLGFFITPALLGGGKETTISQVIIEQVDLLNWAFAGAIGVLLLFATLVAFVIYDRIFGLSSFSDTSPGVRRHGGWLARLFDGVLKIFIRSMAALSEWVGGLKDAVADYLGRRSPPVRPSAAWRIIGGLVLFFLVVPSLFVIPISFSAGSFLEWPPRGFSLRWYGEFFSSPLWLSALIRSLAIGVASAALTMLIAVPAAFAIAWGARRWRPYALAVALSPLIIPRIITAIGLFYLYSKLKLVGSLLGLALGHTVIALPYAVISIVAVLKSYDQRLDQAARSLGASNIRARWHVTLPIIQPGLLAAFLFAFATSFDELTIALFVTGGLVTTLPKQMWDGALLNVTPVVTAASTISLIVVTIIILVAEALQRRLRRRSAVS